jgi:hypothetical protein
VASAHRVRCRRNSARLDGSARIKAKSVVQHFEPRIAAARSMIAMGGGSLEDIDAITARMREFGVRQYGEQTPLIWGIEDGKRYTSVTTGLHEAEETEFIRLAKAAGEDRSGALPAGLLREKIASSGLHFSDTHGVAQRAAIERVGTGGRFELIVAAAGAGKTTALKPLVAAWQEQGRTVYGASLAWRQADDLTQAGIGARNKFAFSVLIDAIKDGDKPDRDSPYPPLKLDRNSVIAIDEFGLLGTRQGLELLRLQAKHGFSIVALGDDKQCTAVQAGATIDLARRALGAERVPEILTTLRQQTERERTIVGLFREGRAAEALDMKRADRTAEMIPGGYDGVVSRVAKLYAQRLQTTGDAPTIAAPTNIDAHRISEAVRLQRRGMELMGEKDLMTLRATDGERNYTMPISAASAESDEKRELAKPVVKALIDGRFFTMLKTEYVGGTELKPSIFAQVTEAIARADGSTGWVVCQSNGCSTTSAYLDPNMAQEIFGRPDGIVAWGPPGSPYEATPVDGGYRITGKWRFMSGSQNATWLGAHLRVAGTQETKTYLYPKSSATFNDIWHTLGRRGTASNEYSVDNLFIPHERAIYRDDPRDRRSDSPLYRFSSNQLYSIGFGGVALGIARGRWTRSWLCRGKRPAAARPNRWWRTTSSSPT